MAVLVTGGAGYIGSHTVAELLDRGEEVVVVDSLETGHADAVLGGTLHVGDIRDKAFLEGVFQQHKFDAVIHFAAYSLVGESMSNPAKYYDNNVHGTLVLLEVMQQFGVKRIVFSSTAATYGEPERTPIEETFATNPTNVYGETKLTMERMMRWFDEVHGIRYVSLRYFNAAGAHESGRIGEDHQPETHLVPIVLETALGKRSEIAVFGSDYPTHDGTCIRDYIHVSDLADAHLLAVGYLRKDGASEIFNLGSGNGFSVLEVIRTAQRVTGLTIPTALRDRRAGDPAVLIASAGKAKAVLGWQPKRDNMEMIIESAWRWHQAHPDGYAK
ncbi:UDP-glucose 4-epimerase GalE [Paenibacillus thiaminolyticus]|uniref:UDP-glucose 4-epimerase n=1 Tax=Paenibacillus thiaminolyticus TaxID=49283 RepID=A0AAP9DXX9_PANTH|nr:UDP-glucose 4-epimerase GalE [Paenibacillus thiaminolyticus]MCY9535355.1 UDP-glucose 4-epimerase GalE [Paenibacillus thiaminolyticus]MCY9603368.1 UDP-glucose 4-epimerase GalE [Paenibacillus thiaminolyticus]MCY9607389.1 UDP-glucose 4-epimerase GalE [Paenibacillus thiaminolyticus]MCY9616447.1 UDP-glucose 4-epimerase GalE [Paenibacillus thiaminolyticus]MCY9621269.1 UDP-glucose 4-epimerase GalE [Paenibacillus thiaminolyticus]